MGECLAKRYWDVRTRNESKSFAFLRPKIRRNIRQAQAGNERNCGNKGSAGWIKDVLSEIYFDCNAAYFYDVVKIQSNCVKVAELLENGQMSRGMYKEMSRFFREGKGEEYIRSIEFREEKGEEDIRHIEF
jgi:hypothetical protein